MSDTTFAPHQIPALALRLEWARAAGQGAGWLLGAASFAATLYLCVAWPGLID